MFARGFTAYATLKWHSDGPNATTTIIFKKSFASDATSKWRLMAHQMRNLCVFSVFHCVEGAFGAASGGTPKMKKIGPREMNSKMVVVVVGRRYPLAAQCSAARGSVAATPTCSATRFRLEIDPLHLWRLKHSL